METLMFPWLMSDGPFSCLVPLPREEEHPTLLSSDPSCLGPVQFSHAQYGSRQNKPGVGSVRPPDKVAANADTFQTDSEVPHFVFLTLEMFLSGLSYLLPRLSGSFCLFVSVSVFLSKFRSHPLALVANALLKPACDNHQAQTLGVHSTW